MSTRRAFRPSPDLVLEDRVVLSRASGLAAVAAIRAAAIRVHPATPQATEAPTLSLRSIQQASRALGTVATLGDSYTDEYNTYPGGRSQARSWVQFLAVNRGIQFGSYSQVSRGESRYQGYGLNYARSNATTDDLLAYQLPQLVRKMSHGGIDNVVILAGGNDYLLPLKSLQQGKLTPTEFVNLLPQITARAALNVETAVSTILLTNPNAHVVVSTIDVAGLPLVQGAVRLNPSLGPLVQALGSAVSQFNAAIVNLTSSYAPNVGLLDLAASAQQVQSQIAAGQTELEIGGATIRLTTVGDDFHNFFQADGVHPGLVAQGLLANQVIEVFNTQFGTALTPLSGTEIVKYAAATQYPTQIHGWKPPRPPIPMVPPGQHFRVV
ncbi:MAG: SGNH/GDSL hydrolase family protein [Isosphaeraceae bacterium]